MLEQEKEEESQMKEDNERWSGRLPDDIGPRFEMSSLEAGDLARVFPLDEVAVISEQPTGGEGGGDAGNDVPDAKSSSSHQP